EHPGAAAHASAREPAALRTILVPASDAQALALPDAPLPRLRLCFARRAGGPRALSCAVPAAAAGACGCRGNRPPRHPWAVESADTREPFALLLRDGQFRARPGLGQHPAGQAHDVLGTGAQERLTTSRE